MQSLSIAKKVSLILILLTASFFIFNYPIDNLSPSQQNIRQTKPLKVNVWSTIPAQNKYLHHQTKYLPRIDGSSTNGVYQVYVDDKVTYQTVDGFGFSLTGGSAQLINKMKDQAKDALLKQLFGKGMNEISVSCLRLSMGSSDLDEKTFSYNDLTGNQTDVEQKKFSIDPDRKNLIPILKKILAINPNMTIISTPWSPPAWMKDNNKTKGGSLKPQYYESYAKYFVKYIQEMGKQGIKISAITPQNEPLHPGNNPSMYFTAEAQRDFIKNNLGPAFAAANITTKIIVYDHNLDRPDYPSTIYDDKQASKYVDGAAFHMYVGNQSVMGDLHNKYPNKNLYFTEQWTSSDGDFNGDMQWHTKNVIIGTMRNWAKTAFQWNLANDPGFNPHTQGGCTMCKGAITISYNFTTFQRNVAYYIIAHASKFVPPGSIRVQSNIAGPIVNVVFMLPNLLRSHYMIAFNDSDQPQTFVLLIRGSTYLYQLQAKQVATIGF